MRLLSLSLSLRPLLIPPPRHRCCCCHPEHPRHSRPSGIRCPTSTVSVISLSLSLSIGSCDSLSSLCLLELVTIAEASEGGREHQRKGRGSFFSGGEWGEHIYVALSLSGGERARVEQVRARTVCGCNCAEGSMFSKGCQIRGSGIPLYPGPQRLPPPPVDIDAASSSRRLDRSLLRLLPPAPTPREHPSGWGIDFATPRSERGIFPFFTPRDDHVALLSPRCWGVPLIGGSGAPSSPQVNVRPRARIGSLARWGETGSR